MVVQGGIGSEEFDVVPRHLFPLRLIRPAMDWTER